MDQKQQIADRLKQANNVLVTVSNNPTVDQLASCIGLTLVLNKMGKHASAVFSGAVPSTLEFLKPEETLETTTDSLRDFIISLDKAKADKLRYKVEDKVVKIFITPFRTSISDKDLEFSQGDFNVDAVVALGVHAQGELDQAITSHGRILHDAAVVTINVKPGGELGSINWVDDHASSLSELAVELVDALDKSVVDSQIATAFLTGIVAETGRFSNAKTSPTTMSVSAELMGAGANQQLVATKLEESGELSKDSPASDQPPAPAVADQPAPPPPEDGTLEITHNDTDAPADQPAEEKPTESNLPEVTVSDTSDSDKQADEDKEDLTKRQIDISEQGDLRTLAELDEQAKQKAATVDPTQHLGGSRMILQPPSMGSAMNATAGMPDGGLGSSDPLSLPQPTEEQPSGAPMPGPGSSFGAPSGTDSSTPPSLSHASTDVTPTAAPASPPAPAIEPPSLPGTPSDLTVASAVADPQPTSTDAPTVLSSVAVPDVVPGTLPVPSPSASDTPHIDSARDAVMQAIASQPQPAYRPEPIQALNAQPLGDPLHDIAAPPSGAIMSGSTQPDPDANQAMQPATPMPVASSPASPPPPVPPPMMPVSPQ